jgi:hypothetical protein
MMAMKLKEKRSAASQFRSEDMMLKGTKRRNRLRYDPNMKYLKDWVHDGSPSAAINVFMRCAKVGLEWVPFPLSRGEVSEDMEAEDKEVEEKI